MSCRLIPRFRQFSTLGHTYYHSVGGKARPVKRIREWIPTIGLEVHATINTRSKLFSPAPNSTCPIDDGDDASGGPNGQVHLFDAAIPGTLPILNQVALESGIKAALALNCTVNTESSFDRKHYFYGDLPLGYQITQQYNPIGVNGYLDFVTMVPSDDDGLKAGVKRSLVKQVQLEQDSGRSLHDEVNGISLIDLNRAGNPLLEIVFHPDLESGEEAASLIKDLIILLKGINVCRCKMEEGSLRVDANISVRPFGSKELGTRTEVKNLNSLRSISRAVDFEIDRQTSVLKAGKDVLNETMRFNPSSGQTEIMRDKEEVMDYRFFPEGNLPLILLRDSRHGARKGQDHLLDVDDFRREIPLNPQDQRLIWIKEFDVSLEEMAQLHGQEHHLTCFLNIMDGKKDPHRSASVVFRVLTKCVNEKVDMSKISSDPEKLNFLAKICDLVQSNVISYLSAEDLLAPVLLPDSDQDTTITALDRVTIDSRGIRKITSEQVIDSLVHEVIESMPKRAKDVRLKGKRFSFEKMMDVAVMKSNRRIDLETLEAKFIQLLQPPGGVILSKRERLERNAHGADGDDD